jgi:polyhydroxyalkanoate synthesis regulator phasin
MNINDETGTITLTEYELHDMIADMLQNLIRPYIPTLDGEIPERIVIEPEHTELFTAEHVQEWEERVNKLIRTISTMDAEYHDDAEQTCR